MFSCRLWMEREPVASGCCAQVYHGWVGEQEVAVKVIYYVLAPASTSLLSTLSILCKLP